MARGDWWYPNIPKKQADALDIIVENEGLKYGILDKGELVRFLVADFMARYEEKHGLIGSMRRVDFPQKNKKSPLTWRKNTDRNQ
jgi:hypothetical protein